MLLTWMAYSMLFGVIVFGAALATERMAATWGRSLRFVWGGALIAAIVVPVIFAVRPQASNPVVTVEPSDAMSQPDRVIRFNTGSRGYARQPLSASVESAIADSNALVADAWVFGSLGLLVLIGRAAIGIRRRRAGWHAAEIDGVSVLIAPNVGPAVVGAVSPRIVIPQWALSLDESARALMLRHEAEHIRARDPLNLFVATLATALFPWNAALWLIVRRLRLAIEIDCDERVLRASNERREYGELLLTVGARLSAPLPLATSLAERRPFLERRLRAMTALSPKHPRVVTVGCIILVIASTTAASRIPRPSSLVQRAIRNVIAPVASVAIDDSRLATTSPNVPPATGAIPSHVITSAARDLQFSSAEGPKAAPLPLSQLPVRYPDSLTVAEIRALIEAHHPTVLAGDPNINTITIVVDARGNYVVSTAESRSLMIPAFVKAEGRGGRGRSGGAAPTMVGGGDTAFARGRVGGGRMGAAVRLDPNTGQPVAMDSAAAEARMAEVRAAIEKLAQALASDTSAARSEAVLTARAKMLRATGDTVVLRQENRVVIGDGMVRRSNNDTTRGPIGSSQMREAGAKIGLNMDVLSRLIDPASIDAVQICTFAAGQMGPNLLRVFVVHQAP
jgi:hypothetical protein